jgi:hypothetical protein
MASINNPFYINLVNLSREEAAVVLTGLLGLYVTDDATLEETRKQMGLPDGTNFRDIIQSAGHKIDDDWAEMLSDVLTIMAQ